MVNERYKIVVHDTEPQYTYNCPVILQAVAITKDEEKNQVLAQCKFRHLGEKQITAMSISVKCYSVDDKRLESLDHFAYMDINACQYHEFGDRVGIDLPDNETRKIVISLTKIVYSDKTIWENKKKTPYIKFEFNAKPISSIKPLDEQYIRELQKITAKWKEHRELLSFIESFVRCGCGEILLNKDNVVCPHCMSELAKLIQIQDTNYLEKRLEAYNKEKEIKQINHNKKYKKWKKRIITAAIVVAFAIGIVYWINSNQFPFDKLSPDMNAQQVEEVLGKPESNYDHRTTHLDVILAGENGTMSVKYNSGKVKSAIWSTYGDDSVVNKIEILLKKETGLSQPTEIRDDAMIWTVNDEEKYELTKVNNRITLKVDFQ